LKLFAQLVHYLPHFNSYIFQRFQHIEIRIIFKLCTERKEKVSLQVLVQELGEKNRF